MLAFRANTLVVARKLETFRASFLLQAIAIFRLVTAGADAAHTFRVDFPSTTAHITLEHVYALGALTTTLHALLIPAAPVITITTLI